MPGIPVHHTEVDTTSAWDKSKVVAETKAELRYVNAWVDGSADAELKGSYKFPHHYKDGGPAILAGVNNAKARLSQASIPKADVAGVEAHLNAHQNDVKQSILQTLQSQFMKLYSMVTKSEKSERAISMPNIYGLVYAQLDAQMQADGAWRALIDVYIDGADMFAVIGIDGLLYKSMVTLANGAVTLGDLVQVEIDYKPVTQKRSLLVYRQADGKYRWFAFPAATAVLNRSGELDSRELFKNFVTRIEAGEVPYPFLSFYHVGEQINLGQADFVAAEEYEYLVSGTFADDPLSQATRKAIQKDPTYYGTSIGYYYMPEKVEELIVADGITIPVYTDGINHEVSILAEKDAACLYTGIFVQKEGVNRMNQKAKDELDKIAGDDPEAQAIVKALEEKVDSINTEITDKNLIRRETPPAVEPPPVAPVTEPSPEAIIDKPMLLGIDDDGMNELAERVAVKVTEAYVQKMDEMRSDLQKQLTGLTDALNEQAKDYEARISKLEAPLSEQVQTALEDMPRTTAKIVYRPRERQADKPVEDQGVSLEEIANATLANLNK